jgi:hypothetical protein
MKTIALPRGGNFEEQLMQRQMEHASKPLKSSSTPLGRQQKPRSGQLSQLLSRLLRRSSQS